MDTAHEIDSEHGTWPQVGNTIDLHHNNGFYCGRVTVDRVARLVFFTSAPYEQAIYRFNDDPYTWTIVG